MSQQKLLEYGLWYYYKYFPSRKKLEEKIFSKSHQNQSETQEVMNLLRGHINEGSNIDARIRFLIQRNKNSAYIKRNLMTKGYEKNIVEEVLKKYLDELGGSLLHQTSLRHKIQKYLRAGKSRRYIEQTLCENTQDREMFSAVYQEFIEKESESLQKAYQKLSGKYSREKIIQKLLTQGFRYPEVQELFKNV